MIVTRCLNHGPRTPRSAAEGHLAHNPLAVARPPVKEHREYRTLTPDQAHHFLAVVEDDRYGALWTLLLTSGLRPGEALALKWEDLEENAERTAAVLRVRRACAARERRLDDRRDQDAEVAERPAGVGHAAAAAEATGASGGGQAPAW